MTSRLSYALVTPTRDEEANLERLARAVISQDQLPSAWVIVDGGSIDGSTAIAEELARVHPFIHVVQLPRETKTERGRPIVRSFLAGVSALPTETDIVVKLDADVSFERDYFSRLLREFDANPRLGIASGSAYEERSGVWRQRHGTRTSVWGACRAYRTPCLNAISPLEQRMGWDSIDEFRANVRGWRTRTVLDLPFRHHRPEGARDGTTWRAWTTQGRLAHYLCYRPTYLFARTIYHATRHPSAIAMLAGYTSALLAREPRCSDTTALQYLRGQQSLRHFPRTLAQALGLRPSK